MRQRLTSAEVHAERLQRENQDLRARLGEPEQPASPSGGGMQMLTLPELAQNSAAEAAEHANAVSPAVSGANRDQPAQPSAEQSALLLEKDRDADDGLKVEQPSTDANAAQTSETVHENADVGGRQSH